MIRPFLPFVIWLCATLILSAQSAIDFRRDIRPILADKCFACHGPDEEHRAAGLRLDDAEAATDWAIVPNDPEASEVIARITTDDPEALMPPPESTKQLTHSEVERIRQWIAEGAVYEKHWAFTTPTRPTVPQPQDASWVRNPIDAFVAKRLEEEGLRPSLEVDRVTWLRRLSLDLIGLPPSIEEVDAFVADPSSEAFDHQIHRLLHSSHFGERWGRIWLDAARYADSDGYEKDKPREMWFYRDWVINAFNQDMPYNEFVIQQIAGDLLPNVTQESLIATGFLRNSMVNEEGGADPEQFRMEAMYDRMDAIGKSVLGLTIQCAQCHTHKYDPLTHEAYYRMFAFLNNTHDAIIPVFTDQEQQQTKAILQQINAIESELRNSTPDWREQMATWEELVRGEVGSWEVLEPAERPYEGQKFRMLEDRSILSESFAPVSSSPTFTMTTDAKNITGLRLELLTHPQLPRRGPGRSIRGTAALTEFEVEIAPKDRPLDKQKIRIVSATADVNPPKRKQPGYLRNRSGKDDKRVVGSIGFAIDGDANTAWTTDSGPGRRNQPRKAVFVFEQPVGFAGGTRISIRPVMKHGGWNNNDNHNCLLGRYRFSLTTDANPTADPLPQRVRELLEVPSEKRSSEQTQTLFSHFRTSVDRWAKANARIESLWASYPEGATQLVLEERSDPRSTFVLDRGDFLSPQQQVTAGVPDFLHPLPEAGESRLTFARWLVDERSPTTARSMVNRIWQAYFRTGLVETSDDLGSQSTPPSHPELLDWLAVELMENNWSLKHIHQLIVSSATYRQSSHVTKDQYERDPYNRLLARDPRFRVDAEIVRDITLAASGLLSTQIGGPSVYPPAPSFLFKPPASYGPKRWNEQQDSDRYRRGIYTFRFRSVPYPMLETFDAVPGNVSCVKRNRSNTPLQALTSLNEPLAMECAQALASRVLSDAAEDDASRLIYAFRRCVSRQPAADELRTLQQLLNEQRRRLESGELDAAAILGEQDSAEASVDRAAWTLVSRVLLSLDETITKE